MKFTKQEIRNLKRLCDAIRVKDKVDLRPGDWFTAAESVPKIYKVISIKTINNYRSTKSDKYLKVDIYVGRKGIISKYETNTGLTVYPDDLDHMTIFSSGKEAFDWLKRKAK